MNIKINACKQCLNVKENAAKMLFLALFTVFAFGCVNADVDSVNADKVDGIHSISNVPVDAKKASVVSAKLERNVESINWESNELNITLNDTQLTVRPINAGTVEVFYEPEGVYQLPSFALPKNTNNYANASFEKMETGYLLVLPELTVRIDTAPFNISFYNQNGILTQEEQGLFLNDNLRGFRFQLTDNEQLLGGGQRVLGMDRRGHRMPLYNRAHYGYTTESNQMYYGLPAVMSTKGYVIAFDNSASGHLDIGYSQQDILQFEAEAGRTSYIFSAGNNTYKLVENFVEATGKQPLPPRWALGNYASRFGYKSQKEVLDTVALFKEKDFPLDAVVLDLYWFGPDIKGHMGNLNWDLNNWPEPTNMISTLKQQGVDTIMITEPFILSSSTQWQSAVENEVLAKNDLGEPRKFDFYFGNTGLVDVFDNNAQNWFWNYYAALNEQGVTGWWGDLGEPEVHPADAIHTMSREYGSEHEGKQVTANDIHNAYGHQWAKMVYNKQRELTPERRPFVMMRAGFLGSQRFGMIPWTGDVDRSWGGLKPQVELALQMGMFGLAYIHSDLGGFAGGETFDSELYTRWMQYGVFQPVYRPHAQDHIAPEPVFHDEATQNIVREYVKLRYSLLPYNYSLSMQNSLTGLPMMRPLFMAFPEQSMERTDAYMWGDAFLVAPITEQSAVEKTVLLPEGKWFDFWHKSKVSGGQNVLIDAPLHKLPVMVKAGSFVPMVTELNNTKSYSSQSLNVEYYADASVPIAEYIMFEDDGKNPNSLAENEYQTLVFRAKQGTDSSNNTNQTLNIVATLNGNYEGAPHLRQINFSIYGVDKQPSQVLVDGKIVDVVIMDSGEDSIGGELGDSVAKTINMSGTAKKSNSLDTAIYNTQTNTLQVSGLLVKRLTVDIQ